MRVDRAGRKARATQAWLDAGCPSPLVVNAKDGSVLVYVPAGDFEMGDNAVFGDDDRAVTDAPRHRWSLSAYWIGVYKVTNAQYLAFVEATGHRVPDVTYWNETVRGGRGFSPELADFSVCGVTWSDSLAYAEWAGCELATEAQWEKACRGPLEGVQPWFEADDDWPGAGMFNWQPGPRAVYADPLAASGYGTYRQIGGFPEWCADRVEPRGREKTEEYRAVRGYKRAAERGSDRPEAEGHGWKGFRLVRRAS